MNHLYLISTSLILLLLIAGYAKKLTKLSYIDKTAAYWQVGYMIFYFSIAPIMHDVFDVFINVQVQDQLISLIRLNLINILCISVAIISLFIKPILKAGETKADSVNFWKKLTYAAIPFILSGIFLHLYFINIYGLGYLVSSENIEAAQQSIYVYMLIESVPMLVGWSLIWLSLKYKKKYSSISFYVVIAAVSVCAIIFSSSRGSRISALFQIVSIVMLYGIVIRKLRFLEIAILVLAAFSFNYFYSVYKYTGHEGIENYIQDGEVNEFVKKARRVENIILHDFGRSDVQAVIYDRLITGDYVPPYFPHSYISAVQIIFPRQFRSEYFESKIVLGSYAQYGTHLGSQDFSSRVYGLPAEVALNFGIFMVPIFYFMFGLLHKNLLMLSNAVKSGRKKVFYPLVTILPFLLLFYDFDNIYFFLIKSWLIPTFVFLIAITKLKRKENA